MSLWFAVIFVAHKSEFAGKFRRWVTVKRNDRWFQYDGYEFCQEVVTDIDGAWSDTNAEMVTVTEDLGIKFLLTSPDRMVTKMSQENMVGGKGVGRSFPERENRARLFVTETHQVNRSDPVLG